MEIDWDSDHAQIVVEEILTSGLVGLVTGDGDRIAQLPKHFIHLGK